MYYVYEHYKKSTNRIFYVGIGRSKNGKYDRSESTSKRNIHWKYVVKKHGFYSKIVFESESRDEVCRKEIQLISLYGRKDLGTGPLVNKTTGGEKTFDMSKDSINAGVNKRTENGTYNKCAEIARQRMLTNNPWKGKTHDGFNKREIFQYDANTGEFIGKYKSIRYATKILGFSSEKIISKCLIGENKTGLGFIWFYEYKGEVVENRRRYTAKDQLKPVIELDFNGNIIKEWGCISDAAKEIGVTNSSMGQAIKVGRLCKGRIFKRKT